VECPAPLHRGRSAIGAERQGLAGAKPKLTGEVEAKLTMLACSDHLKGYARWTLRLLANQMIELGYVDDISHVTVREWLKKTNLSLGA
jgi:putative transposase